MLAGRLLDQFGNLANRRAVGHADPHLRPRKPVDERPVDDDIFQKMAVRNKQVHAVGPADSGRPRIDGFDRSLRVADLKKITDPDRPLPHQDPAADEIVDDVLRAEANSDCNGTGYERERREWDVQKVQDRYKQYCDDADEVNTANQVNEIGIDVLRGKFPDNKSFQPTCEEVADNKDENDQSSLADSNGLIGNGDQWSAQEFR